MNGDGGSAHPAGVSNKSSGEETGEGVLRMFESRRVCRRRLRPVESSARFFPRSVFALVSVREWEPPCESALAGDSVKTGESDLDMSSVSKMVQVTVDVSTHPT